VHDNRAVGYPQVTGLSASAAGVVFPVAAAVALGASFVLVSRLERLASRWHLSEAMLGVVVALAADTPEITSAVTASAHGQGAISAGVVLGSNAFNLAALLGLGALVASRIRLHRRVVLFEGTTGTWVAVVTVVVVLTRLAPGLGLALVLGVVGPYLLISASSTEGLRRRGVPTRAARWLGRAVTEEEQELTPGIHPFPPGRLDGMVAIVSVAIVVGASIVMERTAEKLGHHLGLSKLVIGGVILAAVTSLPNAVGAVYLSARGRGAAVLSEAMNSNMINVVVGLLLPAIFFGLGAAGGDGRLVTVWYAALTVISLALAFAGKGLSRVTGTAIVAAYAAFVLVAITK
jgi:cation:H+ antiporter